MALVRPTGLDNVVAATVAAIDQLEKLTTMLNILLQGGISAINVGTGLATWPGGQQFTSTLNVAHGLPIAVRPKAVLLTVNQAGSYVGFPTLAAGIPGTPGTFQVQAWTTDGSSPAVGVTVGFDWLALN